MKFNDKEVWRIIKKKKSERIAWEKVMLYDWKYKWIFAPIRLIMFPFALVIKLYKWTYN